MSRAGPRVVVIATPHARHDALEQELRRRLTSHRVVRLRGREELTAEALARLAPRYVFFPHWSWIIGPEIYSAFECVVFHMTDLPYGRGGSPLQNLIARGHRDTVLSAIRCSETLDGGPIYLKRPLSLAGTAEEILQRASILMESMIVEIVESRPAPAVQSGQVVEFQRRKPADGNIGSLRDLEAVYDYIRMLDADGYPPAFVDIGELRLEFTDARLTDQFVEATVRIHRKQDA